MTSKIVMNWPTWKLGPQRFLYRCSWGKGQWADCWLFVKSNGNDVGWIKHENCAGCPESCSQDWMYWHDIAKEWYYDKKIRITTDQSKQTRIYSSGSSSFKWWHLIPI